jgi:hypothetical protein
MKPQNHIACSALIAAGLYLFFKSWQMSLACFLSGIFIDIDHIYDYSRIFEFPFKIKHFFNASYNRKHTRMTMILHSWELLVLIGILAWSTNWNPMLIGILIGSGSHIALDIISHGTRLRAYSFMWRYKVNFDKKMFFPDD